MGTRIVYLNDNKLSKLVDKDDFFGICKKVNGLKFNSISQKNQTYNKINKNFIY